ncbi:ABC transporter ATP-binding protein [Heyndrickxia acidicola]|uniref:Quaternary amine transport ATP-binding protein n=1 Tax=Heyndrickxia acidicola TaxID=209389 RepID=A0ABU6MEH4_9BACI|nr:ABC transporter ATP-binding protein [Heyndrickxia acidicola]MED1201662.1 ABC transporter ATP-binding protein [Heyndrickxia acidicola]
MIEFDHVTKKYSDGTTAVNSLTMKIKEGEFLVLIGPSGCGKTTTLKMINRLIGLTEGTISINGKKISDYNIHELRWNIGYVLQQIALFPHMTIEENISIVPELKKWKRYKVEKRVSELLEMVGLEPDKYRSRKPGELSGGQQQRVGVVRALAADPEIILMDEPFSALDPISREKLQGDLADLQKRIKKTIVFVTHDMQEALKLGSRICIMNEGEMVQLGTPEEIIQNPKNQFVRDFIGVHSEVPETPFNLEDLLRRSEQNGVSGETRTISIHANLPETLKRLSVEEVISVEKNGRKVGTINRQAVIEYMADQTKKRGQSHE